MGIGWWGYSVLWNPAPLTPNTGKVWDLCVSLQERWSSVLFSLERRRFRDDLMEVYKIMRGIDKKSLKPYSVEGGYSAHRVYTDTVPTPGPILTTPHIYPANPSKLHIPGHWAI